MTTLHQGENITIMINSKASSTKKNAKIETIHFNMPFNLLRANNINKLAKNIMIIAINDINIFIKGEIISLSPFPTKYYTTNCPKNRI
jgi:hypothetical protein